MDVDLRPLARGQLLDIFDWTAGRFDELHAEAYLRQLNEAIDRIAHSPYIGPIYRGSVRRVVSGQHLIYYELHRDRIVILRVDHGRQRRY